jgi:hypothetical protein
MSYSVEWMGGGVIPVFGIVLVLLVLPQLAAIAVVVATIAVLIGLLALAAAALASPYLLVRGVCRRLCPTKNPTDPLAGRYPRAELPRDRLRVARGTHVTAFAHDEPAEAGATLRDAA